MRIPIVMVSDENYISQTRVTIWTIRKNTNRDTFLEITILCSKQLKMDKRHRLTELENIWYGLKIYFCEINLNVFSKVKTTERIPVTSLFRLFIPEVLKYHKKCLFLDGDIIVNTDLENLYLQDIDDVYMAGVRDSQFLYDPEASIKHFETYGFNDFNHYVNAGVIVFNLDKLREEHVQERFLKCLELYYPYMDQDILNKICDGKIKLLDMKYNYFSRYKNKKVKIIEHVQEQIGIEVKEWEILHFAGSFKPWENFRIRGAKEWWAYAKEALEENIFNDLFAQVYEKVTQNDWSYILKRSLEEKQIVIIGYSRISIDVYTSLKRCDVGAEIFFCDNSKKKQKLSDKNVTIYPVEKLTEKYSTALWINTSQNSFLEINVQLESLGVSKERIIVYKRKDEAYFDMLDDAYIEYELMQLQLKSIGTLKEHG